MIVLNDCTVPHRELFSHPVVSSSLWPHGLQQTSPSCPSPPPGVCQSSCSLHQWYRPAISSSDILLFCPQSFPASGTFPMSHLFTSDDRNTGASASSSSFLPVNIQGWSPLRLTGWSPCCPREFQQSSPVPQFEGINSLVFCLLYGLAVTPMWPLGRP